jgi:hypothetical protein
MNPRRYALLFDALINLILGILLIFYSTNLANFFGLPVVKNNFYPNILGSIFIGITIALLIEVRRIGSDLTSGLGLTGALAINLCGGFMLMFWLLSGNLEIPLKGEIILWILDILLIVLSGIELFYQYGIKGR